MQEKPHKATPRPGDWTDVLAADVINNYIGKHIAIINKRVVAVGDSYEDALEEARRKFPDETPYLAHIPDPADEAGENAASMNGAPSLA